MDKIIHSHLDAFIHAQELESKEYTITLTKDHKFGDYTSNICFIYAKLLAQNPQVIAQKIIDFLLKNYVDFYDKVEFVKPGYINFYLKSKLNFDLLNKILIEKDNYPIYKNNKKKINIEFVSANPTGKLHLAHAYAAIFGISLARVFLQLGFNVQKEYYINDAGNQITLLALSVFIRYLNILGIKQELFEECYHGEEIIECAQALYEKYHDQFKNIQFDNEKILNEKVNETIKQFSKDYMLNIIKQDLYNIDVSFDLWTSEKALYQTKQVQKVIEELKKLNQVYVLDDALWLKSKQYGDDKDRVLIKKNQEYTYLVPDIALHVNKLLRNYDEYYNIWGMDHHGYIARLKIALKMLGYEKTFEVLSIQVMKLVKDGKDFKLSKRAGTSLTLQDLIKHIGKDELKWICTSFQTSSHKIVDVNKITTHDNSNPLFYVEYAYARIFGIFTKNNFSPIKNYQFINETEQSVIEIVNELSLYDQTLWNVIKNKQTQVLNNYLYKIANKIHEFYNQINISSLCYETRKNNLLHILYACSIILKNGLRILGINAYEKM